MRSRDCCCTMAKRRHHSGLRKQAHRPLFVEIEHHGGVSSRLAHVSDDAVVASGRVAHDAFFAVDDDGVAPLGHADTVPEGCLKVSEPVPCRAAERVGPGSYSAVLRTANSDRYRSLLRTETAVPDGI